MNKTKEKHTTATAAGFPPAAASGQAVLSDAARNGGTGGSIVLRDLTIGYRSRKAEYVVARSINATLAKGQLTCLLGPNGSGKSTLLRTLSAFQLPLSGSIELDGRRLDSFSARELSTRIGIVLTERPDVRGMTVTDLVSMGRSPYTGFWGKLSANDQAHVAEAIRLVGIEHLSHRSVHTLSDGERQKCMIAKVLAQQTPIVLLDEPTAFLDFPSKAEMLLLLRRLAHQMGKTVMLSTHDLEIALQTADRLWLLAPDGDMVIGTARELSDNGALARFFSGPGIEYLAAERRFIVKDSAS